MNTQNNETKVLMVYSGKGGVGKSTTTVNTAKNLARQGKRVYIIDGDINSPSLHVILGKNQEVSENLRFNSIGILSDGMVYIQASMIKEFLSDTIKDINKFKPDVVLIDTPPSITDVHINLIEKIKISGVLMVTQANELSMEDVRRTAGFFKLRDIPVVGLIENMTGDIFGNINTDKLGFKKITSIPLSKDLSSLNIGAASLEIYNPVSELINSLDDVILENTKRSLIYDESIGEASIEDALGAARRAYSASRKRNKENPNKVLRFYNLNTWDFVAEKINDVQRTNPFGGRVDALVQENTTERIKDVLEAFKTESEAYFMVNKNHTFGGDTKGNDIRLIVGEIGQAKLVTPNDNSDGYYSIPRINYQTGRGHVTLFPHEVIHVTYSDVQSLLSHDGYTILNDRRYVPPKEQVEELYNTFGARVGLHKAWEEHYDQAVSTD